MRTLKKTLALVLVVAMMMSLCITSNAAFTDADEIEYTEAVSVLTKIGVIDGFPAGDFQPQGSLTRAQAAKILVYILGEEAYAKADGQIFDDVKENHWAADYIAYCAENGLVDGYGDGKFGPEDKLTAYQWAKMLLAALGVDTSSMIGAAWQIPVAQAAAGYDIFAGNIRADKTQICTREEACLYALNALNYGALKAGYAVYDEDGDIVEVYPSVTDAAHAAKALEEATGDDYSITGKVDYYSLSSKLWTIHRVVRYADHDYWGRPGVSYDNRFWSSALTFLDTPVAEYTTATTECDIAYDLGIASYDYIAAATLNGDAATIGNHNGTIDATATTAVVGAQGRLTQVYETLYGYEIVMVDDYFAVVTDVAEAKFDRNGHMTAYPLITLDVYADYNGVTESITMIDFGYGLVVGDVVLVNYDDIDAGEYNYAEIVGVPEALVGAQTAYTTKASHIVEEVEYMDAVQFNLDEAMNQTTDHTWYFDSYGNLIAVLDIDTVYNYGVISAIKWVEMNNTLEKGYALATITYMDGSQETTKVYSIDSAYALKGIEGDAETYGDTVSSTMQYNDNNYVNKALYKIESTKDGLKLVRVTELNRGAYVETNVPNIGTATYTNDSNKVNAGSKTMFLVWNAITKEYETYTGIKNVPSYKADGKYWAANVSATDTAAEYVFINGASRADEKGDCIFFAPAGSLTVKTVLFKGISYYVISGGYVNNVKGDEALYVLADAENEADYTDNAIVMTILANCGKLLDIDTVNGYVSNVSIISNEIDVDKKAGTKAVYAGDSDLAVYDAKNDTLTVNGSVYYTEGVTVIGAPSLKEMANKYLYIVYTENANNKGKVAVYVYVTPVEGTDDVYADSVADAAAKAALAAAKDEAKQYVSERSWEADEKAAANAAIEAVTDTSKTANDLIAIAVKAVQDLWAQETADATVGFDGVASKAEQTEADKRAADVEAQEIAVVVTAASAVETKIAAALADIYGAHADFEITLPNYEYVSGQFEIEGVVITCNYYEASADAVITVVVTGN